MPTRNAPSVLPTTLRFIGARLRQRWSGRGYRPCAGFRSRVEAALNGGSAGTGRDSASAACARCDWLHVTPSADPWFDTGIDLEPDRDYSLLADGMIYASRALDVGVLPQVGLWYRVGDAEVAKILGSASLNHSGAGGRLRLAAKPPGEFADRSGAFQSDIPRKGFSGTYEVAVVRWQGDARAAIGAAAEADPELFGLLHERLRRPVDPPAGWRYLWRLGQGEIFESCEDRPGELCCHTAADVGILQFPVDRPLTADTRLSWSWLVEQLPSRLPEHTEPTHDYLSLAVEFDNGLDLTWMWSAALPVDTIFQCPLAWWNARETHWVVRSGRRDMHRWIGERRRILEDYDIAIGGPAPKRIVAVWLIANTVFQRGQGRCRYRDIVIEDGAGKVAVGG